MPKFFPSVSLKSLLPFAAVLILVFGVAHYAGSTQMSSNQVSSTLHGDPAHPAKAQGWVDTKLYFDLGPADEPAKGLSETGWRSFLDKEVTPRFPAGLSVMDVYGQWQGKDQSAPERDRSKMLVIDYPRTTENAAKVEAIRAAWKKQTGEQSVLKVSQPADVSF